MRKRVVTVLCLCGATLLSAAEPTRVPILGQIALPHNYYYRELYLPQITTGPSAPTWTPDGKTVIYSMGGTLWRQAIDADVAEQLTDAAGTDYQPDCSPDGRSVAFVRYDGRAVELMHLDLATGESHALTANKAVNLEPRWSPDGRRLAFVSTEGTRHFVLHVADVNNGRIATSRVVVPDQKSETPRYYYSPFDHAINPTWSRDGKDLVFVSNHEIGHGTGDIVRKSVDGNDRPRVVQREETSWKVRPDVSPDGTRIVYSSYVGRQWQQLWLLPVDGGYPFPLTYGDYDNTEPRWSPDGKAIAFISNRDGNTALWAVDAFSGEQRQIKIERRRYVSAHGALTLHVRDEQGRALATRVSIADARHRPYAPDDAWMFADDLLVPEQQTVETRYFHSTGDSVISTPLGPLSVTVSHGPSFEVAHVSVDLQSPQQTLSVTLKPLPGLDDLGRWWSGDLHVHMNYGGHYRDTPDRLAAQAHSEDLNLVYNLVVNKEQRVPDVASFRTDVDPASDATTMILHGQEFHSSYWGHIGLLNLTDHLLLPGYTAYPFTAAASPFPDNGMVADLAHQQRALVGYVHPFDEDVDPVKDATLTNGLPVDAALGRVDYYEVVGFSDHKASAAIWYRLLDCGLKIPAGAGTDAMANYASLRGPVGLNRVFVPAMGPLTREAFLAGVKAGRGVATNGARLLLASGTAQPGDTIRLSAGAHALPYRTALRANYPVDHLEIVWNGQVVARLDPQSATRGGFLDGTIPVDRSGWLVLRAWNEAPHANVLDIYPYATTSPIYVTVGNDTRHSTAAAAYFLSWLDRLDAAAAESLAYRTEAERQAVREDISKAKAFYTSVRRAGSER
jgi:TolB protein